MTQIQPSKTSKVGKKPKLSQDQIQASNIQWAEDVAEDINLRIEHRTMLILFVSQNGDGREKKPSTTHMRLAKSLAEGWVAKIKRWLDQYAHVSGEHRSLINLHSRDEMMSGWRKISTIRTDDLEDEPIWPYQPLKSHALPKAIDVYLTIPERIKVDDVRMYPRSTQRTFTSADETALESQTGNLPEIQRQKYGKPHCYANLFFGFPDLGTPSPRETEITERFLNHLLPPEITEIDDTPNEEPKEFVLDWLADKYQRPWHRNIALLFLAAGVEGAGRGTLFDAIDVMFGQYCGYLSEDKIVGQNRRFNSTLMTNLVVIGDEIGSGDWKAKQANATAWKFIVEPKSHRLDMERKYKETVQARSYSSFILATNNPDALPMREESRRFAIIQNGPRMTNEMYEDTVSIGAEGMARALRAILLDRDVTRNLGQPPQNTARNIMIMASRTTIEEYVRDEIREAPTKAIWTTKMMERRIRERMHGKDTRHTGSIPGLKNVIQQLMGVTADKWGAEWIPKQIRVGPGDHHRKSNLIIKGYPELLKTSLEERLQWRWQDDIM